MTLTAGTRLGPYEILSPIGAGGMGEVYRARDSRLGRDVAIKVPPEHLASDAEALARFEREARAIAALTHPNILDIHDVGNAAGVTFVVTELLEGETLGERLRRGALPWRSALEIGLSIAEGLAAAHGCGIVHRDLKPDNVFLASDGRVKILDFGLARREAVKAGGSAPETPGSTATGVLVGTAGYISPEQVRGKRADERSDIFALGCILYEAVMGHRAFTGDTPAEALVATLKEEPRDPADLVDLPEDVRMLILRSLAKKPEARFQSALDLAFALRGGRTPARPTPAHTSAPAADGTTVVTRPRPLHRPLRRVVLLLLAAVIAAAAVAVFSRGAGGKIDSLAVLPFVNTSGDPKAEYLSDGLTESLITSLSRLQNVRVLAWTTVAHYKGKEPLQAARELGVRAVLTGRIVRQGESLVGETELVDVRRGTRLWGDRAPRKIPDAFAAEEIAREVSRSLRARLGGADGASPDRRNTQDPEAYDLYLKGRYFWNKRSEEGIEKSIAFFQQAIERDPGFALAFAGLADSYDLLAFYGTQPPKEIVPRARDAAIRALELDPGIAEAQASLADVLYQFDWDFPAAEQRFRRAIALNGNYATGHQWFSNFLSVSKRFEESFEEIERARQLDPLNLIIDTDVGLSAYWAGQYDRAIVRLRQTLELEPNFFLAHFYLGMTLARKGLLDPAIAESRTAMRLEPDDPNPIMLYGYACARAGRGQEALRALEDLRVLSARRFVSAFAVAAVYVGLDDRDKAFEWLEKAYEERSGRLVYLGVERAFDPLRSDPRFQNLVRRMRLPA
jgi:serine/threonine protein kinase/tetratricopeptide (TPR) repeat protein